MDALFYTRKGVEIKGIDLLWNWRRGVIDYRFIHPERVMFGPNGADETATGAPD